MRHFRMVAAAAAVMVSSLSMASADQITVTQYGGLVATLPWAIALEKDLFQKHDLDVDGITPGAGGGTAIRNMLASSLPIGEVGTPAFVAAVAAGMDLVIVGAASNHVGELAWGALPDSGIESVADLSGKRIGFTNPKSVTEMVIRMVAEEEGFGEDTELLAMGGLGPALTALSQGAIDASPINDPVLTLDPGRYTILFEAHERIPEFTWAVNVAQRDFAEANPETIQKFLQVHREAVEFIYDNPDEAAEIYAKVWEIDLADAQAILPKYIEWQHWSRGEISQAGLDSMAEALRLVGDIEGDLDWAPLVDESYLDNDLKNGDL